MSTTTRPQEVQLRYVLVPLFVLIVIGLLALLFHVLTRSGQLAGFSPGINLQSTLIRVQARTASDFALTLDTGEVVRLSDYRGKPVVINFWASWCTPCREEAPLLEQTYRKYRERGVIFLGINLWDTPQDAAQFRKSYGQTYPSGPDARGKIAIEYGVAGIPETFFITRDGKIIAKFVGPLTSAAMEQLLEELLAQ